MELHLIRQFQGWNGHKQRQLNMRQEEHQFTRWQQQHLQQQRMLEQQLEMLRISHLQLRRQQQDQPIVRGQGSGPNDACGGPGPRNAPTRHPVSMPAPLPMPFAPLPSQLQEQHQLERHQARISQRGGARGIDFRTLPLCSNYKRKRLFYVSIRSALLEINIIFLCFQPYPDSSSAILTHTFSAFISGVVSFPPSISFAG